MKRASGKYLTNRKVYKDVKKMDHQQFDQFCTGIYQDGRESVPGIDITQAKEAIQGVKGIGVARMEKIMEALEEKFRGGVKADEKYSV